MALLKMEANPAARLRPATSLVSKVAADLSPLMALLKMEANPVLQVALLREDISPVNRVVASLFPVVK
ncbi:MAG TPA: hypothetical protein VKF63_05315, partial [Terracidiphilus sp.]|nr:hypothetical protein [Terracidiphilus sp.]